MIESAGTLLYRQTEKGLEVLLVHPSGNYNRGKPWSIPKGLRDEGETLEETARRETWEETSVVAGELRSVGYIEYKKRKKRIHGFAGPAPEAASPRCASWEVDRAEFLPIDEALGRIHPDQAELVARLKNSLESDG